MKRYTVALFLLFVVVAASPSAARASCFSDAPDSVPCWAQVAFAGLVAVDWAQTRHGLARRDVHFNEHNPAVGRDPASINLSAGLALAGGLALSELLPAPWGERLLFAAVGAEAWVVKLNADWIMAY